MARERERERGKEIDRGRHIEWQGLGRIDRFRMRGRCPEKRRGRDIGRKGEIK